MLYHRYVIRCRVGIRLVGHLCDVLLKLFHKGSLLKFLFSWQSIYND